MCYERMQKEGATHGALSIMQVQESWNKCDLCTLVYKTIE